MEIFANFDFYLPRRNTPTEPPILFHVEYVGQSGPLPRRNTLTEPRILFHVEYVGQSGPLPRRNTLTEPRILSHVVYVGQSGPDISIFFFKYNLNELYNY